VVLTGPAPARQPPVFTISLLMQSFFICDNYLVSILNKEGWLIAKTRYVRVLAVFERLEPRPCKPLGDGSTAREVRMGPRFGRWGTHLRHYHYPHKPEADVFHLRLPGQRDEIVVAADPSYYGSTNEVSANRTLEVDTFLRQYE